MIRWEIETRCGDVFRIINDVKRWSWRWIQLFFCFALLLFYSLSDISTVVVAVSSIWCFLYIWYKVDRLLILALKPFSTSTTRCAKKKSACSCKPSPHKKSNSKKNFIRQQTVERKFGLFTFAHHNIFSADSVKNCWNVLFFALYLFFTIFVGAK